MTALDRLRRARRDGDEGGFALIFVLLVTTMVMLGVSTTLVVTTPNITAAKRNQDTAAALLAAQSGVDDAIAYLTNIPSCRSETRICPQALGANSTLLSRPVLNAAASQTFTWTTAGTTTDDGYVRVTSTGTSQGVSKKLVADLSLQPSILSYGYYTDYESQSPTFLNDYYGAHKIYLSDATTYSNISSSYRNNKSAPQTATWNAPASTSNCGQHWYYESTSVKGRGSSSSASSWTQSGKLNGTTPSASLGCDLVFTSGMVEDGKTYTRDALDVSYSTGIGPIFNQPVTTLWGYNDGRENFTSPSVGGQPWRGNAINSSSPYKPTVATFDLTLPKSIGTDGLSDNSCVYLGPTRVVLNGDGTATVTSPGTTSKNAASDPACYPTGSLTGGIVNFRLNYATAGSGTVYVKNLGTAPSAGWPDNGTKATQTPAANNEVFYYPTTGTATPDASASVAPSTSCTTTAYSATPAAACAWTNLKSATDGGSTAGWTTYASTTKCNTTIAPTERQLFECEYSHTTGATTPSSDQYAALRSTVQSALAGGTCATDTIAAQTACVQSTLTTNVLTSANSGQHAYNYASPATNDHQYYAVSTSAAATTSAAKAVATTAGDPLFSYKATTSAQEKATQTPITTTVYRQVYTGGKWQAGVPQFTFTITHSDWAITQQATGTNYFPAANDVTDYNSGTTTASPTVAAGSSGTLQPGDLYVEGQNNGRLSLIAQNDVVVTGDVTDTGTTGSDSQAVDIVAGGDVRNYHPMSCVDTTAADITATDPGWCPNDISNLYAGLLQNSSDGSYTAQAPQMQYTNINGQGDHTIDAAIFALNGSFRTDNFNRGVWVGNVIVNGGIYQSHRGGNGTNSTYNGHTVYTGLTLNYHYIDLERANLPDAPPASNSTNPRPWNVVSISAGS